MSEWENWKKQHAIKWRTEIEDISKNQNVIDQMCRRQSEQMPTARLRDATYKICKEELFTMLNNKQSTQQFLKYKDETIEISKVYCMSLPYVQMEFQTQGIKSEEFGKCMDEENNKILNQFWELTAFNKIKDPDKIQKPAGYYKNIENFEKEIINLSMKLGFVPSKEELRVIRAGLYKHIHTYKYPYPEIARKVKSIMNQASVTPSESWFGIREIKDAKAKELKERIKKEIETIDETSYTQLSNFCYDNLPHTDAPLCIKTCYPIINTCRKLTKEFNLPKSVSEECEKIIQEAIKKRWYREFLHKEKAGVGGAIFFAATQKTGYWKNQEEIAKILGIKSGTLGINLRIIKDKYKKQT